MATTNPSSILSSARPLIERTNNVTDSTQSSIRIFNKQKAACVAGDVHHKYSFSNPAHNCYSSDTLTSQADSIYNAEVVRSPELASQDEALQNNEPLLHREFPASPSRTVASKPSIIFQLPSHHGQQFLNELAGAGSRRRGLRQHSSIPTLQPSPERASKVVKPQISAHSIHPPETSDVVTIPNPGQTSKHIRSLSLNDLDCFPSSDTRGAFHGHKPRISSSSEEVLGAARLCPTFPCRPIYSPPIRCTTPPGLPSFGTREAQEYRLSPPSPPNRVVEILRRWLGYNRNDSNDSLPVAANSLSLPVPSTFISTPAQDLSTSPPTSILRRVLGVSRLVDSPPQQPNPRSTLPPGISIASTAGPLAQADDGTYVRGRWGGRLSGHGVSPRGIDAHPMIAAGGLQSIDEVVREIDKACEPTDAEYSPRQAAGIRSIEEMLSQSTSHARPVSQSENFSAARARPQNDCSYPIDLQQFRIRPNPTHGLGGTGTASRPSSMISPPQSLRIAEPPRFMPISSEGSTCHDSIAGFRDYIEQREREQARISHENQKQSASRCDNCWNGFWQICCGSVEQQGRSETD